MKPLVRFALCALGLAFGMLLGMRDGAITGPLAEVIIRWGIPTGWLARRNGCLGTATTGMGD